ncbi:methylglyoxal synthase [Salinarimonas rosea]|uniref:methylglyoxal synthase n=1 Tax=Salinarimonas rosea TaxID=552063 RepID=UPI0004070B26|nr:methylglyoxal synthase [Salinarimonas rosea]
MPSDPTADTRPIVALVAHDEKKGDLVAFCRSHARELSRFRLVATGTTGGRIAEALPQLEITRLKSGPLGGDQQIGALIAEERVAAMIFFVDALTPHPHDVDVKALMRLAILYDIPFALNRASAELVLKADEA